MTAATAVVGGKGLWMGRTLARCIVGYIVACIACAAVQVGFVLPPSELLIADSGRLTAAAIWTVLAALHSAVFAAPFALVGLVLAERKGIRRVGYYAGVGTGIAALGLAAQLVYLGLDQPLMVLAHMLAAFLSAGALGGLIYWLVAGRFAGAAGRAKTIG